MSRIQGEGWDCPRQRLLIKDRQHKQWTPPFLLTLLKSNLHNAPTPNLQKTYVWLAGNGGRNGSTSQSLYKTR